MRNNHGTGMLCFDAVDAVASELDMDITIAAPEIHVAAGFFHDPSAEILVRDEEDIAVFRRGFDDFDGVTARHDHISERLHARTAIDVGDDIVVFRAVLLEISGEFVGRTGIRKRAAGIHVGNDN